MRPLWLYSFVSRAKWLNYPGKILLMAFVGTHVPLLAIIGFLIVENSLALHDALWVGGIALLATLSGTAVTLFVLHHLLRPIMMTAAGLRGYRNHRVMPRLPTEYDDEAGTLMADAMATLGALDRAIDEIAHFDKITGLPNRDRLTAEAARWIDRGAPFAVCAVRLDNYQRIVSTFSQGTADSVVRQLAAAMQAVVSPATYLARVEPGTFAVLTPTDGDVDALVSRMEKAAAGLPTEITVDGIAVAPDVNAGVALYPQDGGKPAELLDNAVAAIGSRAVEGNAVGFYSPKTRDDARERFLTEQGLRQALKRSEFVLHYQPVVDVALGRVVGAEALIRWQHPERGLVPPGQFIPVAEAGGLISPIGLWVMRRACAQLAEWSAAGLDDLKVAINISARQFHEVALTDLVRSALAEHRIDPGRLEIELTETDAMRDRAHARRMFGALRDLGVSVAIDDFGTGYSSMSQLKDLPFNKLKIDREFVANVEGMSNARAICSALIALARGLDIEVVAEGAETAGEVRYLRGQGCRLFQGFYFAKPLPAEAFPEGIGILNLTAAKLSAAA